MKTSLSLKAVVVICLLIIVIMLVADEFFVFEPSIVGKWDTGAPTHLIFEFKKDNSIVLHSDQGIFPAWMFTILTEDTLRLTDGMGRPVEYRFILTQDTLDLYLPGQDDQPAHHFTRLP